MEIFVKYTRKYQFYFLVILLFISTFFVYFTLYSYTHKSNELKIAYLDVGQGDAIYIEAPNGKQMLIDSGAGPIVLSKLSEVMPYGDRSIDILLATHADADHIGGFPSVLDNYSVDMVFENGAEGATKIYSNFENKIAEHKIKKLIAFRGTRITLDPERNIYFDILFPDRDVSGFESNDGSIVGRLVYSGKSFMMMGDASKYTELLIKQNNSLEDLKSTVLKIGHHGSRSSSGELWLESVVPSLVIISAGLDNRYGHPSKEVLDRLNKLKIPYLSTMGKGSIILKTDGVSLKESQLAD